MSFETNILSHYQEFSIIFSNITSNDYSDEQKEEMMNFLTSETQRRQVDIIQENFLDKTFNPDKLEKCILNILRDETIDDATTGFRRCREAYLNVLDNSLHQIQSSESLFVNDSDSTAYKYSDEIKELNRRNEMLKNEIDILKEDIEDKTVLIDKFEKSMKLKNSKLMEMESILDLNAFLQRENESLKSNLFREQRDFETKLKEVILREEKLISEINALKDSISVKGVLLKTFENEKEVMFSDFQLLSEEVVERDLIIQSLNDVVDEKEKENVAFLLDKTSDISISGQDLTSTAKLQLPSLACENCMMKPNSVSFLNVSLRRRNVPSPILDSINSSAADIQEIIPIEPVRTKSISDELKDFHQDRRKNCSDAMVQEISNRLISLEENMRNHRMSLERSRNMLTRRNNLMIRYRTTSDGEKLTKLAFTKYEGVRLK